MKIVLVTGSLEAGGAERVLSDMANYWAGNGWQVKLATWSGMATPDFYALHDDVERIWLGAHRSDRQHRSKMLGHFSRLRRLRRLLSSERPDVVLSFIDTSNILTLLAATGLSLRVVVSERTHPAYYAGLSWLSRFLRKHLYTRAHCVVAQTDDAARWIGAESGAKVMTIPNALRSLPDLDYARQPFILSVGRLGYYKGFDVVINAFALLRERFPDWRLRIVGSGSGRSELLALRDKLHLEAEVQFLEPIRDIELMMSRASLVVQASRLEGFPNVVLEAMGMGAAVIAADCNAGPAEIITDGVNGCLVPVDDVHTLADEMGRLMSQPEIREQLGQNAMSVRSVYHQDRIMAQWEECFLAAENLESNNAS